MAPSSLQRSLPPRVHRWLATGAARDQCIAPLVQQPSAVKQEPEMHKLLVAIAPLEAPADRSPVDDRHRLPFRFGLASNRWLLSLEQRGRSRWFSRHPCQFRKSPTEGEACSSLDHQELDQPGQSDLPFSRSLRPVGAELTPLLHAES